jgi:hypothetical protein
MTLSQRPSRARDGKPKYGDMKKGLLLPPSAPGSEADPPARLWRNAVKPPSHKIAGQGWLQQR